MFTFNILAFLRKDKFVVINFLASLILNIFLWSLFYFFVFYAAKQDSITLHYTIYFGINWIGPRFYIFIYPLFGTLVFIINTIIAFKIYFKERILSYFLFAASTFLAILLVILGILMYIINT